MWTTSSTILDGLAHLPAIFTSHVAAFSTELATSFYRPGMHIFFIAVRGLFGVEPWAFHLVNVLLHAACSVLVVLIARAWMKDGAIVTGLLFAVHPVHVEAVAYARSGRMELAIPELEKAVLLRPDVAIYRENLERARAAK